MKILLLASFIMLVNALFAQTQLSGSVSTSGVPVQHAHVLMVGKQKVAATDSLGRFSFENLQPGNYTLSVSVLGFNTSVKKITLGSTPAELHFTLSENDQQVSEIVVSGTLREVNRLESPVPVEVYSPAFFKKNPSPSIYDALQNINGVRPQLNCNICNTGDIHINGLEGPYTMILVDGMPIVSSLSTVYGLSGIPNALVERIEIVRGPASSLYGSEAIGGLINIITKKPANAPVLSADVFSTSWNELNADLGFKFNAGKNAAVLTGINYFNFSDRIDRNNDNFTDVTLQKRVSIFQKWAFDRKNNRPFSIAGRYNYEDRWGGDKTWNKHFRGGNTRYAESIYTSRWELIGQYRLPFEEQFDLSFSFSDHDQNSVYGNVVYIANQKVAFSQLTWNREFKTVNLLGGAALRYTYYDDSTPATASADPSNPLNMPDQIYLPGVFLQSEFKLSPAQTLLTGARYDYNSRHGSIFTPRLAYKLAFNEHNILRFNAGTGFRVVNLFTEDHAALTGSRTVEVNNTLRPEKSYNANLNFIKKIYSTSGSSFSMDATVFYTHFNNRILGDFDSDPNKIIYTNLQGYAVSRGLSLNADAVFKNGLKISAGGTLMDVFTKSAGEAKKIPVLTERWTGTWAISYKVRHLNLTVDYTGNIYGPMRLPLLGPSDPRSSYSPVWSIQNIQFTYSLKRLEMYAGVKNLLNFVPGKNDPFLIARTNDPFDKTVQFDNNNQVIATADNPYALTFDPNFVYAPNQGIRGFFGVRLNY